MKLKELLEVCDDILDFSECRDLGEIDGKFYAKPGSNRIYRDVLPVPEHWFDLDVTSIESAESIEHDTVVCVRLKEGQKLNKIDSFSGEYEFLSNFYPCKIVYDGLEYASAEAAFQAAKFPPTERQYFTTMKPGEAKKAGRKAPLPKNWNKRRLDIMREVVARKFMQNQELAEKLIATGDAELIEGNWWGDNFWGVCWKTVGKGHNHLGKILMELRDELMRER